MRVILGKLVLSSGVPVIFKGQRMKKDTLSQLTVHFSLTWWERPYEAAAKPQLKWAAHVFSYRFCVKVYRFTH